MTKKEFTKKQLKKQLGNLNEASTLKLDMKKSFDALKKLDHVTTGQKIGDLTITKAMNKKIKNAKRYIEDLWDKITDGEIEEKETSEGKEVEEKNEQSEGHGEMYNALQGVREGKVIKMTESTLKRVVERVVVEQGKVIKGDNLNEQKKPWDFSWEGIKNIPNFWANQAKQLKRDLEKAIVQVSKAKTEKELEKEKETVSEFIKRLQDMLDKKQQEIENSK